MVISILLLGLLLGMKHAIEADRVAALATLATRSQSLAQTVKLGAVWGFGHTLTLLLFGGLVLALDLVMPNASLKRSNSRLVSCWCCWGSTYFGTFPASGYTFIFTGMPTRSPPARAFSCR